MSREFSIPISECDADQASVEWYRQKLALWTEWFSTDEHSVWHQFAGMMWNDTVFRTLNESRRLAYESGEQRSAMNSVIRELLDEGYVAFQTAAIRKLIEPAQKNTSRQVISLRRVLDDMKEAQSGLTREVYVCFDGTPYEYDDAYAQYLALKPDMPGFTGIPASGPGAFNACSRAHAKFDKLSRVDPTDRSRQDLIAISYFDVHEKTVQDSGAAAIADYCNKFIAHAADAASRKTAQTQSVSLKRFEECHRKLYKVAFAIYLDVLTDSEHSASVLSHRHPCENLSEIWSNAAELKQLYRFHDEREEFIDSWRSDYE